MTETCRPDEQPQSKENLPRSWRMYAQRDEHPVEGREFRHFGNPWYVRAYGGRPVAVELTEDPDGNYYGWIYADLGDQPFAPKYTGEPTMIQPHSAMFAMQFPYGPEVLVKRGDGEIVRMNCREVDGS